MLEPDARRSIWSLAPNSRSTACRETQIVAFRGSDDGEEHVALVIGAFGGQPPLVRLHSECLTGDVFGSLKCDCGPQLKEALRIIGDAGGGVLLYLRQEGRGIGLANKLRAYALQDRGLDTVDANRRLGFADDERDYAHAAAMLRALGIDRVRLLTNNPAKVAGLEAAGIAVVERVAHHMPANPHNADYLATKRTQERAPALGGFVLEQRRSDPDRGRAEHHRRLVIARHSHAEAGDAMTPRELRKQREIGRRLKPSGGIAISPASGSGDARTAATRSPTSAIAQPPFCSSSPIFTWT